jgi:hypothetical protein
MGRAHRIFGPRCWRYTRDAPGRSIARKRRHTPSSLLSFVIKNKRRKRNLVFFYPQRFKKEGNPFGNRKKKERKKFITPFRIPGVWK